MLLHASTFLRLLNDVIEIEPFFVGVFRDEAGVRTGGKENENTVYNEDNRKRHDEVPRNDPVA